MPFYADLDLSRPWLKHLAPIAGALPADGRWREAFSLAASEKRICNHRGLPIRFVPQSELPDGVAYEAFISDTGAVPAREGFHDFFNALAWLRFPRTKARLNALHAQVLNGVQPPAAGRGKLRDAATIFDENAALFVSTDKEVISRLRERRWHDLFVQGKDAFDRECEVWLFGHALLEKLERPFKQITAHAWLVEAPPAFIALPLEEKAAWIDKAVAGGLHEGMTTAEFCPLPVAGIPGWWALQDAAFYADESVFRPGRSPR